MKKLKLSVLFGLIIGLCILSVACSVNSKLEFMTNGAVYKTYQITGKSALLPPEDPEIDGYTFEGWFWDDGVWVDLYAPNSVMNMKLSKNIRVYAKLVPIEHGITYHLDGGTNHPDNPSAYNIETLFTLNAANRLGCNFLGWYADDAFENKVTQITKGGMEGIDLYAKWEVVSTGGETDPMDINSAEDLLEFANQIHSGNRYQSSYFVLTCDIDLGGAEWTPMGGTVAKNAQGQSVDTYFSGIFEGGGFTIKNFKITKPPRGYVGLFGVVTNGTVKNLGVENFNINVSAGDVYAGALIGYNNRGTVENCYAEGNITASSSTLSSCRVGGLIGQNTAATVTNCYATGDVSGSAQTTAYAGGLVGYNYSSSSISNSYATGNVNSFTSATVIDIISHAGGLVGANPSSTIINCHATGNVESKSSTDGKVPPSSAHAGGLAGNSNGTIISCYATGNVTALIFPTAGGLIGYNRGAVTGCYSTGNVNADTRAAEAGCYAGGFIGLQNNGDITDCYATGSVTAKTTIYYVAAGGFVGFQDYGTLTNCYTIGSVSATTRNIAYGGGFAGLQTGISTSINCFATGDVTAATSPQSKAEEQYAEVHGGGFVGLDENGQKTNCYRYSAQKITLKKSEATVAPNTKAAECTLSQINNTSFYTGTLTWSGNVWNLIGLNFAGGIMPTLMISD